MYEYMIKRIFGKEIERRVGMAVRAELAVRALDDHTDKPFRQDTTPHDRYAYDRQEILRDALEAWRVNPLARRIVSLTSQYVVGGGLGIESPHSGTHDFLNEWWQHRLNRMDTRAFEWCDELTRSGNLFVVISTDAGGMSYVRAIPASGIEDILTAENDIEQELFILEKPSGTGIEGRRWQVYDENNDARQIDGSFDPVILHYAINRLVGAKWGESDLAPVLRWLARYSNWLEDRARLNRYRNTFLFWVKARFQSQGERVQRQAELNVDPPNPGTILVTDETETWEVLSPKLESTDAEHDGLALKKMFAVGSANPLHFLAEPESATRTTAEASGGPTYRHYEQRQLYFAWALSDVARVVINRRAQTDRSVSREAKINVLTSDISSRDNASLASAASQVIEAFGTLWEHSLIDDAEYLRVAYRFAGELVDVEDMLRRGRRDHLSPKTRGDTQVAPYQFVDGKEKKYDQ